MDKQPIKNRRKRQTRWILGLQLMSLLGWVLFTFALVMSFFAAPETDYGLVRYHELESKDYWSSPLSDYLFLMLVLIGIFSLFCIYISQQRTRRATDDKYYNFFLLFIISIAWIVYLIRYL